MQVNSGNIKAFALYSKLDFEHKETMTQFEGFSKVAIKANPRFTVRRMTPEDVPACDALFQECNGITRTHGLEHDLEGDLFVAWVALENDEIVGYNTGFGAMHHYCVREMDALIAMYIEASKLFRQESKYGVPVIHCIGRLYPQLNRFLLSIGMRAERHNMLMVNGFYQDPAEGFVHAPDMYC
jgi:hypothetical protein